MLSKKNEFQTCFEPIRPKGFSLPLYYAHKHYTYGNYTLVRVTKTTVLQRQWIQSLDLSLSSKLSRQPVFGPKSEMLKL